MPGMFDFMADIAETDHNTKEIFEALKEAANLDILVGIPDDGSARDDSVSNAELLFIHTNGSPLNGIPARPVIEAALEHDREQAAQLIEKVADAALSGDKERVYSAAERAGTQGANLARAWFTNPANGWPKLKEGTIKARKRRMTKKGKEKADTMVEAAGGDTSAAFKPLIDSDELRKSITYKVRKK